MRALAIRTVAACVLAISIMSFGQEPSNSADMKQDNMAQDNMKKDEMKHDDMKHDDMSMDSKKDMVLTSAA